MVFIKKQIFRFCIVSFFQLLIFQLNPVGIFFHRLFKKYTNVQINKHKSNYNNYQHTKISNVVLIADKKSLPY